MVCRPCARACHRQGGPVELPFVTIADEPRFSYRGVHLDCARHFFPVDVVKQFLDLLALHGCNQFHWHLTDDQGWRFEVKALPELAKKGSVREQTVIGPNSGIYDGQPYGGYYTQDECREIVRYAAERYINVIPEIDLPGHMQATLHVYPEPGLHGRPLPRVAQIWGVSATCSAQAIPRRSPSCAPCSARSATCFRRNLSTSVATNAPKTAGRNAPSARPRPRNWA